MKGARNEKTEPPLWSEYGSAAAWYASDEWKAIVRESYESHRDALQAAIAAGDTATIDACRIQVKACERQLGITAPPAPAAAALYFRGKLI